jgi:hypothetical protein
MPIRPGLWDADGKASPFVAQVWGGLPSITGCLKDIKQIGSMPRIQGALGHT